MEFELQSNTRLLSMEVEPMGECGAEMTAIEYRDMIRDKLIEAKAEVRRLERIYHEAPVVGKAPDEEAGDGY